MSVNAEVPLEVRGATPSPCSVAKESGFEKADPMFVATRKLPLCIGCTLGSCGGWQSMFGTEVGDGEAQVTTDDTEQEPELDGRHGGGILGVERCILVSEGGLQGVVGITLQVGEATEPFRLQLRTAAVLKPVLFLWVLRLRHSRQVLSSPPSLKLTAGQRVRLEAQRRKPTVGARGLRTGDGLAKANMLSISATELLLMNTAIT